MSAAAVEASQVATLERLLSRLSARREAEALVVFDLDDTVLSTEHRHVRILREFALSINGELEHADAAWRLARVERGQLRYAIADTARAAGVADERLLARLRDFWFARFFSNEYLRGDEPVPGAPAFCREAAERGAVVVYMTGRDVGMREGTVHALARHGFPLPDGRRVRLILKPRFDAPDLEFKTAALRELDDLGEVAGAFENEPAHINLFHGAFPSAVNVFVDTKHSGKPIVPHPAVPWIGDFRRS